jgi:hypothetical protein
MPCATDYLEELMRFVFPRTTFTALFAAMAIAGCGTDSNGSGRVSLLMTDAPGDVLAAVVTVSAVRLQGDGGAVVLLDTPYTTDLLDLAGTTALLAEDVVVENGDYREIRFVITGGYVEVDNGDGSTSFYASSPTYDGLPAGVTSPGVLQMPSFGTSGLKVKLPGDLLVVDDDDHVILVDFDAAQSFGQVAGNSGQWVMHPVITASVD